MTPRRFDRHVRKEAGGLVRDARRAIASKRDPDGSLKTLTAEVERGLADKDLAAVRRALPKLDDAVDALHRRHPPTKLRQGLEVGWSLVTLAVFVLSLRAFVVEAFKIPSSSMYPTLEIGDHIFVNKFIYGLRIPFTDVKLFQFRDPHRGEVIVFEQPCQPGRDYIKRVIGLPGDAVEVRCSVVYVNGKAVPSVHVPGPCAYRDRDENGEWKSELSLCSRYRETVDNITYDTFHRPERHHPGLTGDDRGFPFVEERSIPHCAMARDSKPSARQKPGKIVDTKPGAGACETQLHYEVPAGHVFVMGDNRGNSNDSRFWGSVPVENIKGKALFRWLSYSDFTWAGIKWHRMGDFVH